MPATYTTVKLSVLHEKVLEHRLDVILVGPLDVAVALSYFTGPECVSVSLCLCVCACLPVCLSDSVCLCVCKK